MKKSGSVGSDLNKRGVNGSTASTQQQRRQSLSIVIRDSNSITPSTEILARPPIAPSNSLKKNPFIQKDIIEREKEGKSAAIEKILSLRRNPLNGFPEKCPPGGSTSVVLYTTSLRGVRRTFEDCNRLRTILETHRVASDERDVSLHAGFLSELKELLLEGEGEEDQEAGGTGRAGGVSVPRMFVHGRYLGGAEEVVELNESGKLGKIMSWARVERGVGALGCEGCGGARFVPCLECGGSCKVLVVENGGHHEGAKKERCGKCNENGLVHCPLCH